MKIPIISKYVERKNKKASDDLVMLREFFNKENNPGSYYNKGREILQDVSFEGGVLDHLRLVKKELGNFYNLDTLGYWVKSFSELSTEERVARVNREIFSEKSVDLGKRLKEWVEYTKPILTDVIENNLDAISGLRYYAQTSGDSGMQEVLDVDGSLSLRFKGWSCDYGDGYMQNNVSSDFVSSQILGQFDPSDLRNINLNMKDGQEKFDGLVKLVGERNELTREIEKRTGRNLKKEVYEKRKNMQLP